VAGLPVVPQLQAEAVSALPDGEKAMRQIIDHGVPFDDIAAASMVTPPLTTMRQDTQLAGDVLLDTVLNRMRSEQAEATVLPCKPVVRKSFGAAR